MKKILLIFSLLIVFKTVNGQQSQSVNWFKEDSTRFSHVLDFEIGAPGGIGYNFFYRPWNQFSFGSRLGVWTRKSGVDIVPEQSRRSYFVTYNLFVDYRIWKSNFLEIGMGYYDVFAYATSTNTEAIDFPVYSSGFLEMRAGMKTFLFDRAMIRIAAKFQYDQIPKNWIISPTFSLGYKF